MKKYPLILFIIIITALGIGGFFVLSQKEKLPVGLPTEKKTEITATGQKELKIVIFPSIGNTVSNEITIIASSVPPETTAIAFALVPAKEQFAEHHVLGWDRNGGDGWSYGFDTPSFNNGTHSLMVMAVKQMGEPPLEIASAKIVIQNEETGFISPPTTEIRYRKSLVISEYTALRSDVKRARELGANMVTLAFNLDITKDNQVKIPSDPTEDFRNLKKKLSSLINEAHKQGLQVELRTVMVPESAGATDTEGLLANMLPFMRDWAKFAQDHKVYSFTTFGEVDDGKHSNGIDRLNRAVLLEARKIYNGKVGVGFCCTYSRAVNPSPRQSDVSGYDYIIISIYPGGGSGALQRYYDMLVPSISDARNMAKRYKVDKVHIGEVGVLNFGEENSLFFTAVVSQDQEAEFYNILFMTTNKIVDGYSLPYSFLVGVIKDQPAEGVLKEWFGKL